MTLPPPPQFLLCGNAGILKLPIFPNLYPKVFYNTYLGWWFSGGSWGAASQSMRWSRNEIEGRDWVDDVQCEVVW